MTSQVRKKVLVDPKFVAKVRHLIKSDNENDHRDAASMVFSWVMAGWYDGKVLEKLSCRLFVDAELAKVAARDFSRLVRPAATAHRRRTSRKSKNPTPA